MNNFRRAVRGGAALGAAVALAFMAGCGGPPKAQVSGTVTFNGEPIENGIIQFYPAGGAGQTAGGGIENGKYQLETSTGEMTVTINASKVVGKRAMYDTPDSPKVDVLKELIPAEYNTTSTLKVTLKPGVNEKVDFNLKSGKK
ncbi:hypothetical protein GobsT_45660 [Gemmata obscuriglobus]|uniref:hypothetical protein n=1 Tax=Gemmata obscuriglobus TaxID=114 RepID=UPI0011CD296F|nr:hypothetical protein [Gemmata obscuriglobus]QEG29768.1 hypothetical protein GobsT_45660 [Gemmata obscuriglobus]VTS09085.1 Uncharacterized protein OS=Planctomyces limnophilus (strain ATCC 43296 / DSM 3776 / IFAM 1008 / 290) GN=Plim_2787 PE=4 SV=1 [Gemmata obscuriglobus UQM 2246]